MDKKYTINDIIELLSEQTGRERVDIEKFLKELISTINEGIIRDQIVNVKGIGTFKIVLVKERESVSVNTGERIVIPPHHKLSFLPVKTMKELINKPFASFDTIEAREDVSGMVNLTVSEKGSVDENLKKVEEYLPVNEGLSEDAIVNEPSRPPSDREIIERIQEENLVSTPPPPVTASIPPPIPPSPPPQSSPKQSSPPHHERKVRMRKKKSKKTSTSLLLGILFFLILILLAGGGWYFFFYNRAMDDFYTERFNNRIAGESTSTLSTDTVTPGQLSDEINTVVDSIISTQQAINEIDTAKIEIPQPIAEPPVSTTTPETAPPPTASSPATTTSPPPTTTATGNNVLARVTMESGQRLTLISERYYGLKVFWVYIYEFNKDKIGTNPDRIPIGMEILVPAKEVYGIDATSTTSVERATSLQRRIMAGY